MSRLAYERNLWIHKVYHILGARFIMPILALFYIASQVTFQEFSWIMGVFSLTILILEVPSGVISDILGRKKTIIISYACMATEIVILSFFNGFWPLFVAKIISGIGVSLISGTSTSHLYETLVALKRTKEHKKITGQYNSYYFASMAVIFIIGAYLFTLHPKLPALATLPLTIVQIILSFFLIDTVVKKPKISVKLITSQFTDGFKHFFSNKIVVYLSLFMLTIFASINIGLSSSSVYFQQIAIPLVLIGVFQFIGSLTASYVSKHTHALVEKYGEKKMFFFLAQFMLVAVFFMAFLLPYIGFLFYLLIPISLSMSWILNNDVLQHKVPKTHRATVISISNFFREFAVFVMFPLFGYLSAVAPFYGYMSLFVIILGSLLFAQRYAAKKKVSFEG